MFFYVKDFFQGESVVQDTVESEQETITGSVESDAGSVLLKDESGSATSNMVSVQPATAELSQEKTGSSPKEAEESQKESGSCEPETEATEPKFRPSEPGSMQPETESVQSTNESNAGLVESKSILADSETGLMESEAEHQQIANDKSVKDSSQQRSSGRDLLEAAISETIRHPVEQQPAAVVGAAVDAVLESMTSEGEFEGL